MRNYRKRGAALFLCAIILCLSIQSVSAETNDTTQATLRVVADKQVLNVSTEPTMINKQPYVPLRTLCDYYGGVVQWDAASRRAVVTYAGQRYMVTGVIKNNCLLAAPEDIGTVFGITAVYDPVLSAVVFDRGELPSQDQLLSILPRYNEYDGEDVYWLSRIVEAEATGETYESRLAVASVILNRLREDAYPDTVKAVIFDKKHGVQFTPTANGSVYNDPSTLSFLAALDALEGRNNAPGALFFMNPKYATSFWMQKNRQYAFTIGGHSYYY